jgi:hypothetical protein
MQTNLYVKKPIVIEALPIPVPDPFVKTVQMFDQEFEVVKTHGYTYISVNNYEGRPGNYLVKKEGKFYVYSKELIEEMYEKVDL